MDSAKEMASGVAVVPPGASSSYCVAPRAENLEPGTLGMVSPAMIDSSERKKRGRPRKYKPDEPTGRVLSPVLLSSSAAPETGKSYVKEKEPGLARPINLEKKHRNKIGAEKLDGWVNCFTGSSFLPHVLTVNTGEDISTKIMEFSLRGPRTVSVISGSGMVSNVTIRHLNSSGSTFTYEGMFEILSLSGSLTPVEMPDSKFRRSGMVTISLSGTDGRVVGGLIAGLTIAASPVKVVVASFLLSSPHLLKPEQQNMEAVTVDVLDSNDSPAVNLEKRVFDSTLGTSCSTSENPTGWTAKPVAERSRKSAADINISLQG